MDAKELKDKLNSEDIKRILISLGGEIWSEDEDTIILNTICHGGDSPNKLWYYKESKTFYCYTHCGVMDIISLVCEVKDFSIPKSIDYICTLLGISNIKEGFGPDTDNIIEDWKFINSYKSNYNRLSKEDKTSTILNPNLMNMFQKIYTNEWVEDGISKEVMEKYNIQYSTFRQSIIIPHYDIDGNLIGIRQRALLEEDIAFTGKYTPFSICGEMYNHPLSSNLYGIHMNKDTIKEKQKVMIVESEKGVLQVASMFGVENNFSLALCGCAKISNTQRRMLVDLGVKEVIIALDRQYEEEGDENYHRWIKHLTDKIIKPLLPYFNVYVLWDRDNLLDYKDSPTDKGEEVLLKLMKSKIYMEG